MGLKQRIGPVAVAVALAAVPLGAMQAEDAGAVRRADELAAAIEASDPGAPDAALLRSGFDVFVERMDAFDGERAVRLGRALFAAQPAVWSAFCLEGALRRSAPAGPDADASRAAHAAANQALRGLIGPGTPTVDRVALEQRLALLHAGFRRGDSERAALGAAIGMGGVDATQIVALAALAAGGSAPRNAGVQAPSGPEDPETAAALFASLLDRSRTGAVGSGPVPASAPWALRGHGLAALEAALR
ncbi:MAG: hypothetical protein AAFU73_03240 [Planctomycetota bacterium]